LRIELNELEQNNILEADEWAFSRKRNILQETFLRSLHRRMFYRVWKWAGDYRLSSATVTIIAQSTQATFAERLLAVRCNVRMGENGLAEPASVEQLMIMARPAARGVELKNQGRLPSRQKPPKHRSDFFVLSLRD
jgi:fido (protein-threonine AMPylation protein)